MALMTWSERGNMITRINEEIGTLNAQMCGLKSEIRRLRKLLKATRNTTVSDQRPDGSWDPASILGPVRAVDRVACDGDGACRTGVSRGTDI